MQVQNFNNISDNSFEKEKKYSFGTYVINVKREYCGKRKIGEVISEMIVKKEVAGRQA
jgi:hypothetical protein